MTWLKEMFDVDTPVIGMCHLPALPGDPQYPSGRDVSELVQYARQEVKALQDGGIDGILISNEFSLPYLTRTEPITATVMARIIGEIHSDITVPFGVNVLWDGVASLDLAVATGAGFVREIYTGAYASDFGVWDTNVGAAARHRVRIGGQNVRMLFNIVPEAAAYLADRDLGSIARSTVFNACPDGVCVSGLTAGAATDLAKLEAVKAAAGGTPVIVNTGVNVDNVVKLLGVADGAIVGTHLKRDGVFENPADPERVAALMTRLREGASAYA